MRKSIFEDARIRAETKNNENEEMVQRGRGSRSGHLTSFARPPSIEKNIVRTFSPSRAGSGSRNRSDNGTFVTSRNPSVTRLHHDSDSNHSSLHSTQTLGDSKYSHGLVKVRDNRSSRYRHPLSAYSSDHVVEAIIPNHSNMLYQKYQRSHDGEKSTGSISSGIDSRFGSRDYGSKSTQRTNLSVSMHNDLIPAFNGMKMDLGQNQEEEDDLCDNHSYASQSSNGFDNKHASSELMKALEGKQHEPKETAASSVPSSSGESECNQSKSNIGRIQQRINDLKSLTRTEGDERLNRGFSSIQQKVLIESLKNELISLRRYNHKPVLDALRRISKDYTLISQPKTKINNDVAAHYGAILTKSVMITPVRSPASSDYKPSGSNKKEANIQKLKTLLKASSSIIEELWEDTPLQTAPLTSGLASSEYDNIPQPSANDSLPETRYLKEQLENFQYGNGNAVNHSVSFDPSPRTSAA
jgi:hypothetical protein